MDQPPILDYHHPYPQRPPESRVVRIARWRIRRLKRNPWTWLVVSAMIFYLFLWPKIPRFIPN